MKVLGIDKELFFKNKNRREIFITTPNFTIENAKKIMLDFVINNPSKETQKKNEIIKELENLCNNNVLIEQAKVEQKKIELALEKEKTKQLKLQINGDKFGKIDRVIENIVKNNVDNNVDNDIFSKFLKANIKKTDNDRDRIHCSDLYSIFKVWISREKENIKIPSSKELMSNIRKYVTIKNRVRIEKKVQQGIEGYILVE